MPTIPASRSVSRRPHRPFSRPSRRSSHRSSRRTVAAVGIAVLVLLAPAAHAAITIGTSGGTQLTITSDGAGDTITPTCTAGRVVVNGVNTLECADTTSITVRAGGGNDVIDLTALRPTDLTALTEISIETGGGADTVLGSFGDDVVQGDGDDVVQGMGGRDTITNARTADGGEGDDVLDATRQAAVGGPGDDTFRHPQAGPFDGGPGIDTLDFDFRAAGAPSVDVTLTITDSGLQATVAGPVPTTTGFSATNIERYEMGLMEAGVQVWDSSAFSGSVLVRGYGGTDRLTGGTGEDALYGGDGDDVLVGGAGFDILDGGTGNDTINSRDGAVDRVRCGPGTDTVVADAGDALTDCESVDVPPTTVAPAPTVFSLVTGPISGPGKVARGNKARFRFTTPTAGAAFQCQIDAKAWKPCASPYTLKSRKLSLGKHRLSVRAVAQGVADATPSTHRFRVTRGKR